MTYKSILTTLSMIVFLGVNAQETNAPKFGKGLFNLVGKDSTFSMNIFQTIGVLRCFQEVLGGYKAGSKRGPTYENLAKL